MYLVLDKKNVTLKITNKIEAHSKVLCLTKYIFTYKGIWLIVMNWLPHYTRQEISKTK